MFHARKKRLFPGSSDRALANCVSGRESRSSGGVNNRVKIFCARRALHAHRAGGEGIKSNGFNPGR